MSRARSFMPETLTHLGLGICPTSGTHVREDAVWRGTVHCPDPDCRRITLALPVEGRTDVMAIGTHPPKRTRRHPKGAVL